MNKISKKSKSWEFIIDNFIKNHNFDDGIKIITAEDIKGVLHSQPSKFFTKEPRIITKLDSKKDLPKFFVENNLFVLPIKNGEYAIIKGDGYVEIENISGDGIPYKSKLPFDCDGFLNGTSESENLDKAYAISMLRTFLNLNYDEKMFLTIRGRKYSNNFSFYVNKFLINVSGVQIEIDAGFETKDKLILIEAKNSNTRNTIIRQLFYPYLHWKQLSKKEIILIFFEKNKEYFSFYQYIFTDEKDYNSIKLIKSEKFYIQN